MTRVVLILAPLALCLSGCYTCVRAPGAIGKVLDADTGAPVQGAHITRPYIAGPRWIDGLQGRMEVPPDGLPAETVSSDKSGRFDFPPVTHTQIAFMYHPNPKSISESFVISADGYATNQLQGVATSRSRWRVDLGRISLKKP